MNKYVDNHSRRSGKPRQKYGDHHIEAHLRQVDVLPEADQVAHLTEAHEISPDWLAASPFMPWIVHAQEHELPALPWTRNDRHEPVVPSPALTHHASCGSVHPVGDCPDDIARKEQPDMASQDERLGAILRLQMIEAVQRDTGCSFFTARDALYVTAPPHTARAHSVDAVGHAINYVRESDIIRKATPTYPEQGEILS